MAEGGQGGSGTALKDEQEIKRLERFRNCEDIHMIEPSGVALISCDPGRDWWNTVMVSCTLSPREPHAKADKIAFVGS